MCLDIERNFTIQRLSGKLEEAHAVMSDQVKDKLQRKEKKVGKLPADGSHGTRGKETAGKTKE